MGSESPSRVLVIGAGVVGLSCAWSLQDYGVEVQLVDRKAPGAGSSWQNAGFVSPSLSVPLPEPSILRYGIRAVLSPGSPVKLALRPDRKLAEFMVRLARHCTHKSWAGAMAAYRPLNAGAVAAYEAQREGGVSFEMWTGDVLSCFEDEGAAALAHEIEMLVSSRQGTRLEVISGAEARELEPHLSPRIVVAVRIPGQHYLTPSRYVAALADSVRQRGGKILEDTPITSIERRGGVVVARGPQGEIDADAVVVANGAWASALVRPHGVRVPIHAGRGYSFTAPCRQPFRNPAHFPSSRVAVSPQGDRVRVSGIMEFASPETPLKPQRIETVLRSARRLLSGVDFEERRDDWVGSRPLSADGVPLVGPTRTEGVYLAGGHGMWGVTLGPVTGRLLAERVVTGSSPPELAPLDPTR